MGRGCALHDLTLFRSHSSLVNVLNVGTGNVRTVEEGKMDMREVNIKQFVPELAVETLNIAILPWARGTKRTRLGSLFARNVT